MTTSRARQYCTLIGAVIVLPAFCLTAMWTLGYLSPSQIRPPTPTQIAHTFVTAFSHPVPVSGQIVYLQDLMLVSLGRVILSLLCSIAFGVCIGFLLTSHRLLWAASQPTVDFLRSLPVTLLAPAAAILQGISNPNIPWELAAIPCTLIMVLQVRNGMERIAPERVHAFQSMSAVRHPVQVFVRLIIWEMAPDIMAGVRIAGSYAIVVVSVLEYAGVGSRSLGFGAFIAEAAGNAAQPPELYAGLLMFGLLGFVMNKFLEALDSRASLWRRA